MSKEITQAEIDKAYAIYQREYARKSRVYLMPEALNAKQFKWAYTDRVGLLEEKSGEASLSQAVKSIVADSVKSISRESRKSLLDTFRHIEEKDLEPEIASYLKAHGYYEQKDKQAWLTKHGYAIWELFHNDPDLFERGFHVYFNS